MEEVSAISATIQSVGVLLLAALLSLVSRALAAPYLSAWAGGFWALGAGLSALQVSFWWPAAAPALQPLYHLGGFAFVAALAAGIRRRADPDAPRRWLPAWAWAALAAAAVALPLAPGIFTLRFLVHATAMAAGFAWAAVAFARAPGERSGALGRGISIAALALLAVDFALYPVAFGALPGITGWEPPGAWAHFTSLYDLLLEVVLAFGLVVVALQDASAQLRALRGLLPVCAWCRKLRDDQGYWSSLEGWVRANVRMDVTHGMCPDCYAKQVGEAPTPR